MSDVKSKNLFELLGNDHEYDSDKEPEPPVKTVEKTVPRAGKRDAPKAETTGTEGAAPPRRNNERRGGGFNEEERGFRDRTNGRNRPEGLPANQNREKPLENSDGTVRGRDSGPGVQRGGRGQRGPRRGGDRHVNRTGHRDTQKQGDQGWGHQTGEGEQDDEKAGEQLAQADKKQEVTEDAAVPAEPIPEPEPEPEDTNMSYAQYLEQQAQKKMEGLGLREARAPNEGAKDNKKWKNAAALSKDTESDAYFVGEAKAKRERERVQKKQVLDIDYAFKEPPRESRGGARGGRGRGEGRGGRGRGEGRGEGRSEGRGDYRPRGDRADRGSDRGSYRGGRGRSDTSGQPAPATDESAFPALGGK